MGMVYVAGAIDLQTADDKQAADPRDVVTDLLTTANYAVYRPDHGVKAQDISVERVAKGIQDLNYAAISGCVGMVAVVSSRMSVGTVMDMLEARRLGKPVVVVLHGIRKPSYLHDWDCVVDPANAVRVLCEQLEGRRGAAGA